MIRDFADFDDGATLAADICIVGGGAAGITIAREFIGTRFSVLMLEAGGLEAEEETQKLYDSEVVGLPHIRVYRKQCAISYERALESNLDYTRALPANGRPARGRLGVTALARIWCDVICTNVA